MAREMWWFYCDRCGQWCEAAGPWCALYLSEPRPQACYFKAHPELAAWLPWPSDLPLPNDPNTDLRGEAMYCC